MDTNLDLMATVMVWGSIALLVWGASLVIGQLLASCEPLKGDPANSAKTGLDARHDLADGSLF
jgi:hypothetical protein